MRLGIYGLALAYTATTLVPAVDAALTPTLGTPFQINQNRIYSNTVIQTSIAGLENGNFVVARVNDFPGKVIGQILFPDGTTATNEFTISSSASGYQGVSIANLTNSKFFVVWNGDAGGNTVGIVGRTYNADGTSFATSSIITTATSLMGPLLGMPQATGLKNGNVLVSWYKERVGGNAHSILGRILSPAGVPITDQFQINQNQVHPSSVYYDIVMGLADGNALVAWVIVF